MLPRLFHREGGQRINFPTRKSAKRITIAPTPSKTRSRQLHEVRIKKRSPKTKIFSEWSPPSPEMINTAHGYLAGVLFACGLAPATNLPSHPVSQPVRNRALHKHAQWQYGRRLRGWHAILSSCFLQHLIAISALLVVNYLQALLSSNRS